MIRRLIFALFITLLPIVCNADILYWQIDGDDVVHNADGTSSSLYTFLVPVEWTSDDNKPKPNGDSVGDAIVAARVNVCDAQGNVLKTLENVFGNIVDDSWHSPVDIGHPNSPNGVGAIAQASNLNNNRGNLDMYYQLAILSRVQGEWNSGVFQEIAWSALYSGQLLDANGNYVLSDEAEAIAALIAWMPHDFYTYRPVPIYNYNALPEPSSGLLLLIGTCLLVLRRKHI